MKSHQAFRATRFGSFGLLCRVSIIVMTLTLTSCLTHFKKGGVSSKEGSSLSFIAFGDFPYTPEEMKLLDKMKTEILARQPNFVVHVGDIKGGSSTCTNESFIKVKKWFDTFPVPLIYTPGDNEWTDCHRSKTPPNSPLERLNHLRKVFFPNEYSLGSKPIKMRLQSQLTEFQSFPENRQWKVRDVLFATIHVVGSENHLNSKEPGARKEFEKRELANLFWLNKTFARAQIENVKAVVIVFHGDLRLNDASRSRKAYEPIITKLINKSREFKKPLLLVHGDHHKLVIDQPFNYFKFGQQEFKIKNLYRLMVYGSPEPGFVEVKIRTNSNHQPFSFNPVKITKAL